MWYKRQLYHGLYTCFFHLTAYYQVLSRSCKNLLNRPKLESSNWCIPISYIGQSSSSGKRSIEIKVKIKIVGASSRRSHGNWRSWQERSEDYCGRAWNLVNTIKRRERAIYHLDYYMFIKQIRLDRPNRPLLPTTTVNYIIMIKDQPWHRNILLLLAEESPFR